MELQILRRSTGLKGTWKDPEFASCTSVVTKGARVVLFSCVCCLKEAQDLYKSPLKSDFSECQMKPWIPECCVFLVFFKQKCNIDSYTLFFMCGAETKIQNLKSDCFSKGIKKLYWITLNLNRSGEFAVTNEISTSWLLHFALRPNKVTLQGYLKIFQDGL